MFNGLVCGFNDIWKLSGARSRSVSPENFSGEKGRGGMCEPADGSAKRAARELGRGWKVNPFVVIEGGETFTLADIEGPGAIQHIWMTPTGKWRDSILRIYWDGQAQPSVECPVGDFFCSGWQRYRQISSLAVCTNPGSAFNCYWPMPFGKRCLMTLENRGAESMTCFYQIDYALPGAEGAGASLSDADAGYFHAQFRRVNPLAYAEPYVILDGVSGRGHYAGTYLAWGVNNNGWWGEGEIKFYLDGDGEWPTICGTGTEDYFCGSYDFEDPETHDRYVSFSTPYTGFHDIQTDALYKSQKRFGMYRWHITDPVRFESDIKVTIQALGWYPNGKYEPLTDDISSTVYWYQTHPHAKFPEFPSVEARFSR